MPDFQQILGEMASWIQRLMVEVFSSTQGWSSKGLDRLLAGAGSQLPAQSMPDATSIPNLTTPPTLPASLADVLGAVFIGLCLIWGGGRGLSGALVTLAAFYAGSWAARAYHAQAASLVQGVLTSGGHEALAPFSPLLGYALAFGSVTLLVTIVGEVVRRRIKRSILGWPDLIGGMIAGGAAGVLLFVVAAGAVSGTAWGASLTGHSRLLGWVEKALPGLP